MRHQTFAIIMSVVLPLVYDKLFFIWWKFHDTFLLLFNNYYMLHTKGNTITEICIIYSLRSSLSQSVSSFFPTLPPADLPSSSIFHPIFPLSWIVLINYIFPHLNTYIPSPLSPITYANQFQTSERKEMKEELGKWRKDERRKKSRATQWEVVEKSVVEEWDETWQQRYSILMYSGIKKLKFLGSNETERGRQERRRSGGWRNTERKEWGGGDNGKIEDTQVVWKGKMREGKTQIQGCRECGYAKEIRKIVEISQN